MLRWRTFVTNIPSFAPVRMTLPQTEQRLENETITHASPPLDMPTGEEPPDGTDIVSEWQEGPHRVVERRAGPGEDVG